MNLVLLEKFYKQLATKKSEQWEVSRFGLIRSKTCGCPLEAVTGLNFVEGAHSLGFNSIERTEIIYAADNHRASASYVRDIRARMLEILGLSEERP